MKQNIKEKPTISQWKTVVKKCRERAEANGTLRQLLWFYDHGDLSVALYRKMEKAVNS